MEKWEDCPPIAGACTKAPVTAPAAAGDTITKSETMAGADLPCAAAQAAGSPCISQDFPVKVERNPQIVDNSSYFYTAC